LKPAARDAIRGATTGFLASLVMLAVLTGYAIALTLAFGSTLAPGRIAGTTGGLLQSALAGPVSIRVGENLSRSQFEMSGVAIGMVFLTVLVLVAFLPRQPVRALLHAAVIGAVLAVTVLVFGTVTEVRGLSALTGLLIVAVTTMVIMVSRRSDRIGGWTTLVRAGLWAFLILWILAAAMGGAIALAAAGPTGDLLLLVLAPLLLPGLGLLGIQGLLGQPVSISISPPLPEMASAFAGDAVGSLAQYLRVSGWLLAVAVIVMVALLISWQALELMGRRPPSTVAGVTAVAVLVGAVFGLLALLTMPLASFSTDLSWPEASDGVPDRTLTVGLGPAATGAAALMMGLAAALLAALVVAGLVRVVRRLPWVSPAPSNCAACGGALGIGDGYCASCGVRVATSDVVAEVAAPSATPPDESDPVRSS